MAALRRDRDEVTTLLTALAELFVHGQRVEWRAVLGDGVRADLPTYPFQHQRYWLEPTPPTGDVTAAGLDAPDHPLLAAVVELPDSGALLFSGILAIGSQPWLADHRVHDTVVVPGTALVELALAAGERAGTPAVDELVLRDALTLPAGTSVRLRVLVTAPDHVGRRTLTIYSRPDDEQTAWTTHATGVLTVAPESGDDGTDLVVWPPSGAEQVSLDGLYEAFADAGLGYGPAFRNLRQAWRRGDTVFAEVTTDEATDGYGLHPALFDAALHAIGIGGLLTADGAHLPFTFSGIRSERRAGATLRVRLTPGPATGTVRLALADASGLPVAEVDGLTLRPVTVGQLSRTADRLLFGVEWVAQEVAPEAERPVVVALGDPLPAPVPVVLVDATARGAALDRSAALLAVLRNWLADPGWAESRLVVRTFGAAGAEISDPDGAALWGLVRSAQSEHPDRIHLLDGPEDVVYPVPQAVVRDGVVSVPRLVRLRSRETADFGTGTVVVTGATGTLGGLVARHLVEVH
ncbi:polyketide synthase dehydratase domain-containing protein, partial [Microbispora bryophytorum]|uniref:polyketide synthase dehydratase domain-containing protein n=1 Tax=Microbispora bryophytorum TaxID=1460882 RepID=UPI003F4CF8C3